tara:strand:- start:176 stop:430 length:255 start_codon:yes stop_codon:yes gene_type:complete
MRIWNTIFTGLVHEKSKVEADLERVINGDDTSDAKMSIISQLLNQYVLVEAKIVKWSDIKTAWLEEQKKQLTPETHVDTTSNTK